MWKVAHGKRWRTRFVSAVGNSGEIVPRPIPVEIEEAAFIDGSTLNSTLMRIVFPMCAPIIATVVILSFLST
jgi:ABC-type sulfate transport system permease component